jgi:hypothetical protein
VQFTAEGAVRSRKTVRLRTSGTAPADRRVRVRGQPGYWYRITAGTFAGYHLREKYAAVALPGRSAGQEHHPAPETMTAHKSYTGLTFADDGTVLSRRTTVPVEDTPIDVVAVGWWNGREYQLARTGPLAGWWIHRAALSR